MARKLRLEFPGACYHVINRGNYRADVFRSDGAKAAFQQCVFEACRRAGWVLHAFVVMRNHFHLAIETPRGNLVDGMQWLESTFASRFNRMRGEQGHLFQGRYKALLVERGQALGNVCHYIHLNPVRARIVSVEDLGGYRFSSYWFLHRPRSRPEFLQFEVALHEAGMLPDTPVGRSVYAKYLDWQAAEGPAGKSEAYVRMSRGWILGGPDFKKAVLEDHELVASCRAWEQVGAQEVREAAWRKALQAGLEARGKTVADLARDRKGAEWKVALAAELKEKCLARNAWLARHLHMGRPESVSSLVARFGRRTRR